MRRPCRPRRSSHRSGRPNGGSPLIEERAFGLTTSTRAMPRRGSSKTSGRVGRWGEGRSAPLLPQRRLACRAGRRLRLINPERRRALRNDQRDVQHGIRGRVVPDQQRVVADLDERLFRAVLRRVAMGVIERHRARLDRHQHDAGMAVPTRAPPGGEVIVCTATSVAPLVWSLTSSSPEYALTPSCGLFASSVARTTVVTVMPEAIVSRFSTSFKPDRTAHAGLGSVQECPREHAPPHEPLGWASVRKCLPSGATPARACALRLFTSSLRCSGARPPYNVGRMIRVGSIVLRVDDLQRQTAFWEAALAYVRREGDSDDFVLLRPRDGIGPNLSLDRVRSTLQIPPRIHLDLYTDDQAGEVERLLALGATEIHWDKRPPDADYVILADPEGNRFCVVDIS